MRCTEWTLALLALSAMLWAQCRPALAQPEEVSAGGEIMRVGYFGNLLAEVNPADVQVAVELWAKQVTLDMGRKVVAQVVFYDDLKVLVEAVEKCQVDMLNLPVMEYLRIEEIVGLKPAMVGVGNAKIQHQYVLLVHRNREVETLDQLRGGTLLMGVDYYVESIADIWLEVQLMKQGLGRALDFFSQVRRVKKVSQAVLPVFFGQVEACMVNRTAFEIMAELNPQLKTELTALAISPALLQAIACFPISCDLQKQATILAGVFKLHEDTRGLQILTLFGVEKVAPFKNAYLQSVEKLLQEHEVLMRDWAAIEIHQADKIGR